MQTNIFEKVMNFKTMLKTNIYFCTLEPKVIFHIKILLW